MGAEGGGGEGEGEKHTTAHYSLRCPNIPDSAFLLRVVNALRFEPEPDENVPADGDDEGGGDGGDDDVVGEDETRLERTDDAGAPI